MVMNAGTEALKTIVTSEAKSSTLQQLIFIFCRSSDRQRRLIQERFFLHRRSDLLLPESSVGDRDVWLHEGGNMCWLDLLWWKTATKKLNWGQKEKKESASHLEGWLFCLFVWLGSGQRAHQDHLVLQKPIEILANTERVFCVTFLRPLTNQPKMRTVKK